MVSLVPAGAPIVHLGPVQAQRKILFHAEPQPCPGAADGNRGKIAGLKAVATHLAEIVKQQRTRVRVGNARLGPDFLY